jgi:hypothetical protein
MKTKQIWQRVFLAVLMTAGLSLGPLAAQPAMAAGCNDRKVGVPYGHWGVLLHDNKRYNLLTETQSAYPYSSTSIFTVPYDSSCSYVNLSNITGGWGTGGRCWSFRLWNRTTGVIGPESGYCAGPGVYQGIGYAPVPNGTVYSILLLENHNIQMTVRD